MLSDQNVNSERPLRQFVTGRNSKGRITIFHRGGRVKWSQRTIDLKRNTSSVGSDGSKGQPLTARKSQIPPKKLHPTPKILPFISIKGQFSFSSIPGMLEDKKVESLRSKIDDVVVGLPKGSRTLSSQSQMGTHMRNVMDVLLSAFSSSNGKKRHDAPYSFVNVLSVPRMAVAGAKLEFFVPRMKDDVKENECLLLNESLRQRGILGDVNESESKSKVREREKVEKDGKFGVDRAPLSYILAT
uniref:Large ribosomal subunit protein uL2 RNA-binding domain-containing protein n=1 Tax=Lactuca sativa TaxID=4236 RepID=A0A9R1VMN1_LACSA|nr:hypothetical protein LSAT_V11C500239090 [Lactuca sativa]